MNTLSKALLGLGVTLALATPARAQAPAPPQQPRSPAVQQPAASGGAARPRSGQPLAVPGGTVPREPSFRLTRPMLVDTVISLPAADGCEYLASFSGVVRPVGRARRNTPRQADADLDLEMRLVCPQVSFEVSDRVEDTGPLSRSELELAIERRASVVVEGPGTRCVYLPDVQLSDRELVGTSIDKMCSEVAPPAPALGSP